MQESRPWITALVTAYARAYHASHANPIIFDDFAADRLFSAEEHTSFNHNLAQMLPTIDPELAAANPDETAALSAVMQLMHTPVTISRSRYTEECLLAVVASGIEQYVILGAGFDTFAFRRPDLLAKLNVFEVDHPVTQAMKRERIANWEIPPQLHFVPVDFSKESLAAALLQSAYDPHKPTFVSWLGVTYYLPREVVLSTLETLRRVAPEGSQIVFDYMDRDAFEGEKAARRVQLMQASARMVGEPMQTGFDPAELREELAQIRLKLVENLSPAEIEARYFQGQSDRLHAFEHVHFARAVTG
ncbi:MAG: SAM-dependent methyltransferase [Chloroflexi bacterium]|nr:SAM-dependent methyltransferase [Chloroflexota bacterium]